MNDAKDIMGPDEKSFWKEFADNMAMVLSYDEACRKCADLLCAHGTPDSANDMVMDISGGQYTGSWVRYHLLDKYEAEEDYERCAALAACDRATAGMPVDYLVHGRVVASFKENCDVCWLVFKNHEMIPYTIMDNKGDHPKVLRILISHFAGEPDKVALLGSILASIE